jgi:hypothetical protein
MGVSSVSLEEHQLSVVVFQMQASLASIPWKQGLRPVRAEAFLKGGSMGHLWSILKTAVSGFLANDKNQLD